MHCLSRIRRSLRPLTVFLRLIVFSSYFNLHYFYLLARAVEHAGCPWVFDRHWRHQLWDPGHVPPPPELAIWQFLFTYIPLQWALWETVENTTLCRSSHRFSRSSVNFYDFCLSSSCCRGSDRWWRHSWSLSCGGMSCHGGCDMWHVHCTAGARHVQW